MNAWSPSAPEYSAAENSPVDRSNAAKPATNSALAPLSSDVPYLPVFGRGGFEAPPTAVRRADIRVTAASVHFLPIKFRVPLKFGPEITTDVICLRVRVTVAARESGIG